MKTCFKCNTQKTLDQFYRHPRMADGLLGKCKECTRKDARENRFARNDYYKEFDKKRASLPHRVEARSEYQKTEAGRVSHRRACERYLADHEDRRQAHIQLGNALRDGRINKPVACLFCGSKDRIEGHHADYSSPLGVTWLCRKCHKRVHRETKMYDMAAKQTVPF